MKPALQALLYAPDVALWSDVILGKKTVTVREGHRDYRAGPVMLCCHIASACVMADIVSVRHCKLGEVTAEECLADGCKDASALLADLRRFYPGISLESPVTVIKVGGLKGRLIDQRMLVMAPENRNDNPLVARFSHFD